jgi:D-glycero-alpha-D-manno-heptose 1-phosphate guanylyltransferase
LDIIILAGGFGTRLKSLVSDVPKPMAPVAGKPFLDFILSSFSLDNVGKIIFSIGYLSEVVIAHFGSSYKGIEIIYEVESEPLGTGGALKQALKHCASESVLVVNGDTFVELNINVLFDQYLKNKSSLIVGSKVEDAARYGSIQLDGEYVIGFYEKGRHGPGLINSGYYLLPTNIFSEFDVPNTFSFENDFLVPNIKNLDCKVFEVDGLFIDIGVPEDYIKAQTLFANKPFDA